MLPKWRETHKLNQADTASRIGAASGGTVSKIEAGAMFPGPELLLNIRSVTGVSADQVLDVWAAKHPAAIKRANQLARRRK